MQAATRLASAGLCALCLSLLSGCTTMLKQGWQELKGAQGEVHPITEIGERALMRFNKIEFEPATTTVGPKYCPPSLLRAYDDAALAAVTELSTWYTGGSPALSISTEVLYFQKKGLLSKAMCLTRINMTSEGRLMLDALVLAESGSFRAGDEEALAEACVKAIQEFLEKQKGVEEEEREEREKARKREQRERDQD